MKLLVNIAGLCALCLVQGAALPVVYSHLQNVNNPLPPIEMVICLTVGLVLFLFKSLFDRDFVLILSNGAGAIIQAIVLILLIME